jgi:hypothetical protein
MIAFKRCDNGNLDLTFVFTLDHSISACDAPFYFDLSNEQHIHGRIYDSSLLVACLFYPGKLCRTGQGTYNIENWKKRDVTRYNVTPVVVIDTWTLL